MSAILNTTFPMDFGVPGMQKSRKSCTDWEERIGTLAVTLVMLVHCLNPWPTLLFGEGRASLLTEPSWFSPLALAQYEGVSWIKLEQWAGSEDASLAGPASDSHRTKD